MSLTCTTPENYLIVNCINGDRKSQKELYTSLASKMFPICLRYTKNQMDAEDILQEGFVKLFNNLHKFRGEGSFEGWVRRIFVNTAIESLRKKNLNITGGEGIENSVTDKQQNGLHNLYEKDIMSSANILSSGYKTVFRMYAVEGYSHKEIANQLGITESTSKSQFSRAKALLRTTLQRSY